VTYKACSPCSMPSIRNWIANVDLPVPLEPRMTTVDFGQNPPSIRLSSRESARYFLSVRHGHFPLAAGPLSGGRGLGG